MLHSRGEPLACLPGPLTLATHPIAEPPRPFPLHFRPSRVSEGGRGEGSRRPAPGARVIGSKDCWRVGGFGARGGLIADGILRWRRPGESGTGRRWRRRISASPLRKECACTGVRFFAILSMQRSGSGWVETLLNSHPNISSNGEIFSVKDRRSNITAITKTLDKLYNLDWYSSAAKNECTAAVGLKWMLNQGLMKHHQEIVEYFNRRGVSAIFLLRRNLLRRYVSILANAHDSAMKQLNGTHKAHVHSKHEAEILAQYKPTIDKKTLITELKRSDKLASDALVNFKNTRHVVLYYEDVVSNRTMLMDVLDFLRVPKRKLSSRHVKIHTKQLCDHIDNWADVNNFLKGTRFESFLNGSRR
ncbi:uncharacterized protein [Miscanthus floridulus]|uniref:uncharacterized protein isoform X2 n=1 Tax=Miscanthus floridulus TaxID=154761 RepID=UPI0034591514